MMKKTISIGIVSLFAIGGLVGIIFLIPDEVEAPGPTEVSGIISENTTWTVDDSPVIIKDNTTLNTGITLTIEAGTEIKFKNNTWLIIRGKLHVKGNSSNRVVFTNEDPIFEYSEEFTLMGLPGYKYNGTGINYYVFVDESNGGRANISYAKFEYSIYEDGALTFYGKNVTKRKIIDTIFTKNRIGLEFKGLMYKSDDVIIKRCMFENNYYGTRNACGSYFDSIFQNNTVALYSPDEIAVYNCSIIENKLGIYHGGDSYKYCRISNNDFGFVGSGVNVNLIKNSIDNNKVGLLFPFNPRKVHVKSNNIHNNSEYNIKLETSANRNVTNNWWGTTNTTIIDQYIYDIYDDPSLGEAIYKPFSTSPEIIYNQPPNTPMTPSGPASGAPDTLYSYSTSAIDPGDDKIKYGWDWDGDGVVDEWSSLVESGTEDNRSHSWLMAGIYNISVKAIDEFGAESGWSDLLTVTITVEVEESNIEITGITLSKYGPSAGEIVTIYAEIQNNGNNDSSVLVKFYDGDPSIGGTQIGDNQTVLIPSGVSVIVSVEWTAIAGNHDLYVIAEDFVSGEEAIAYLSVEVGEGISPILVLTTGDINIYRFEPNQERTISVEVTCYLQTVNNVHLIVLDDQNLTIDHTITPYRTMADGETSKFHLRIKAPELPEGVEKLEKDILIQAVGDNGIFSNAEELDIVVSQSAVTFLNPITIAGAVVTGSLATLGAAAAASRRNENWKYLLLLTFAVPLYTRIHGKKTLDNFVRGQVYGHIQSKPGTHFNEIRKTLKLGNGNLAYHLRKLEKEGFIFSKRDKRYRRFYPVSIEVPEEDGIKLSKTQENILDFIERYPKSNQKEIAKSLKESQQTISYNINILVREGFLKEEKIEGTKTYEIFDENT